MDTLKYTVDDVRVGFKNKDEKIVNHVFENIQHYKEVLYEGNIFYLLEFKGNPIWLDVVIVDVLFSVEGGILQHLNNFPMIWLYKVLPILDFNRLNTMEDGVFLRAFFSKEEINIVGITLLKYIKESNIDLSSVYPVGIPVNGIFDNISFSYINKMLSCEDDNIVYFIAHMNYKLERIVIICFLEAGFKDKDSDWLNRIGKLIKATHQYSELNNDLAKFLYLGANIEYDVNKYGEYDKTRLYDANEKISNYISDLMDECFPLFEAKEIEVSLLGIELKSDDESFKL